ncbi:MAG: 2-oxoacid:acceptor oxidoreductase subunit alpha, partial [Firmicutes bacterium]|nr:2-oxoacid:acceptor oxidoreductase subunit alpha [Bacillota bacterium]
MAGKRFQLLQGNEAVVEGAIAAGMRFYAGYPITPSTEIAERSALRLPQVGGKFVQ